MGLATMMLIRTLDSGQYDTTIHCSTMGKMWCALSKICHALVSGTTEVVSVKAARKLKVTKCPTHGDWFDRFMLGVRSFIGGAT